VYKANPQVLEYLRQFLANANGVLALPNDKLSPGLDVFTPFSSARRINPEGDAIKFIQPKMQAIHALSVKQVDDVLHNVNRLSCDDFTPSDQQLGAWWSICAFQMNSAEETQNALEAMYENGSGSALVTMQEVYDYCNIESEDEETQILNEQALETIQAFLEVPQVGRKGLSSVVSQQPSRFESLDTVIIAYDPSGSPGSKCLWSNEKLKREAKKTEV